MDEGVIEEPITIQKDFSRVVFAVARKSLVYNSLVHGSETDRLNFHQHRKVSIINTYLDPVADKLLCHKRSRLPELMHIHDRECKECGYNSPVFGRMMAQNMICEHIIMPLNLLFSYYDVPIIDWNIPGWGYSRKGIRRWVSQPLTDNLHFMASVRSVHLFLRMVWFPSTLFGLTLYPILPN